MNCVTPHCAGTLRIGQTTGFCPLCHTPVSACTHCGGWNRPFAIFCRQCGRGGTTWRTTDPVDLQALRPDPRRTVIPAQITARPQSLAGFLWALSEEGDLYRLNPYAPPGEQLHVHDRFWADPQTHTFCLTRLNKPFGEASQSPVEDCAIVATADRILLSGLHSRQRRSLMSADGEPFLVNHRDNFQPVVASSSSIYILSRYADQISFRHLTLHTADDRRFTLAHSETPVSGPVLFGEPEAEHLALWSATSLWIYTGGNLSQIPLPEGVALPTSPTESTLNIPPGASPALPSSSQLFLACTQFGRPALLRLAPSADGFSITLIAVIDPGTLSQSTTGQPLLSTTGRLLTCTGPAFRTLVADNQIASRFPAFSHEALSVFFCEADYHGRKQWLKAYAGTTEFPIAWDQSPNAEVHACEGFWTLGTSLCTVCVVAERTLRTEFLSWCV